MRVSLFPLLSALTLSACTGDSLATDAASAGASEVDSAASTMSSTAATSSSSSSGSPSSSSDPGASTGASTGASASSTSADASSTGDASSATGGSEGDSESDGATTGEPPLELELLLITEHNRHHETMMGGWGPHLRGLMRDEEDALWFTVDVAPDVLTNAAVRYMRRGPGEDSWAQVAESAHAPGVQQNAATVLSGGFLYTYSVNVVSRVLEECYLDTSDPAYRACNTILISNLPYQTPPSSNYVGAAVSPAGARVVWFTVVGQNGGEGQWIYLYNFGGGWNGPVEATLAGGNDFAYVRASFADDASLGVVGQLYYGAYPNGEYRAAVSDFSLGQVPSFTSLTAPAPATTTVSGADIVVDPDSGARHVLARTDAGAVAYYHRPGAASWADHADALYVFENTYRARFLEPELGALHVARGGASGGGITLVTADGPAGAEAIDWATASVATVPLPRGAEPDFDAPSAIYVESRAYQTTPTPAVNFAFCGEYMAADNEIWQARAL